MPRDDSAAVEKMGEDVYAYAHITTPNTKQQQGQATMDEHVSPGCASPTRNPTGWLMKIEDVDIDGGGVGDEPMSPVFIAPPNKAWSTYRLTEPWSESYDGSVEVGTLSLRNEVGRANTGRPWSMVHSTPLIHSFHTRSIRKRGFNERTAPYILHTHVVRYDRSKR